MTTHKVLDTMYTEDEGQEAFSGTQEECYEFISTQSMNYGMIVVPLLPFEIEFYNEIK